MQICSLWLYFLAAKIGKHPVKCERSTANLTELETTLRTTAPEKERGHPPALGWDPRPPPAGRRAALATPRGPREVSGLLHAHGRGTSDATWAAGEIRRVGKDTSARSCTGPRRVIGPAQPRGFPQERPRPVARGPEPSPWWEAPPSTGPLCAGAVLPTPGAARCAGAVPPTPGAARCAGAMSPRPIPGAARCAGAAGAGLGGTAPRRADMSGVRAVSRLLQARRLALSRAVSRPRGREQRPRGQGRGGRPVRHPDGLQEARGRGRGGAARGPPGSVRSRPGRVPVKVATRAPPRDPSPARAKVAASAPGAGAGGGRAPKVTRQLAARGDRASESGAARRPALCSPQPSGGAAGARARGPRPGSVLEPEAGSTSNAALAGGAGGVSAPGPAGTCGPFALGFGGRPSCALVRLGRRSPARGPQTPVGGACARLGRAGTTGREASLGPWCWICHISHCLHLQSRSFTVFFTH